MSSSPSFDLQLDPQQRYLDHHQSTISFAEPLEEAYSPASPTSTHYRSNSPSYSLSPPSSSSRHSPLSAPKTIYSRLKTSITAPSLSSLHQHLNFRHNNINNNNNYHKATATASDSNTMKREQQQLISLNLHRRALLRQSLLNPGHSMTNILLVYISS